MILTLNGPFGVGKTTTAELVRERLPRCILFEPEAVGQLLRCTVPPEIDPVDDFQDLALWTPLTMEVARMLVQTYDVSLVIPMTIWHADRAALMLDSLRAVDPWLVAVQLTASRDVLRSRILGRRNEDGPHDWCLAHLESGLAMSDNAVFGLPVATDGRTPAEVAQTVLHLVPQT